MVVRIFIVFLLSLSINQSWAFDDPTKPGGYRPSAARTLKGMKLESVLISAQRKVAIINGKSYQSGDSVGGAKLVVIEPHRVTMRKGSKTIQLKLFKNDVKTQSRTGARKISK